MMNIVKSRTFWATSILYLNDYQEREGFMAEAVRQMATLKANHADAFGTSFDDYLQLDPSIWSESENLPFVTSFTELSDSLSQWRAYCPYGAGISIGFDVAALELARLHGDDKPINERTRWEMKSEVTFRRVEYAKFPAFDTVRAEVIEALRRARESSKYFSPGSGRVDVPESQAFRLEIEAIAATYKDYSFQAEEEHRLLAEFLFWGHPSVGFRTTRSSLVPYVVIEIPTADGNFSEDTEWNAVRQVVVGPTPNPKLTVAAVKNFLFSQGLRIPVTVTSVPYRDW